MSTCNHPIGSVACVLDEGHEGGHQGIEESTQWLIDPEFSPLPSGAVAVWFGEAHRYIALPKALAERIVADHNRASTLDATLTRAQTAEAALQEKHDLWLDAINHGVEMERRLGAAEAALAEAKASLRAKNGIWHAYKHRHMSTTNWEQCGHIECIAAREALARIDQHPTQEAEKCNRARGHSGPHERVYFDYFAPCGEDIVPTHFVDADKKVDDAPARGLAAVIVKPRGGG